MRTLVQLHEMLCAASDMLVDLEMSGMRLDLAAQGEAQRTMEAQIAEDEASLAHYGLANPNSHPQVKDVLRELTGKEHKKSTKEVLRDHVESGSPAAAFSETLLRYRRVKKRHGTYVAALPKYVVEVDGVPYVFPNMKLHTTETGRLASSDPNMQNQPKDIQNMFVPDTGDIFVQGDLSQAEFRVIAVESKDPEALALYTTEGGSIHDETAVTFYGQDYLLAKDDPARKVDAYEMKRKAKTFNFGLPYGRTEKGVAYGMGVSIEEATGYFQAFFDRFSGIRDWQKDIRRSVTRGIPLRSEFGRAYRQTKPTGSMDPSEVNALVREAMAFVPQSTASDITLTAAILMHQRGYVVKMLVHDSILVSVKEGREDKAMADMRAAFAEAGRVYTTSLTFASDIEAGYRWGDL